MTYRLTDEHVELRAMVRELAEERIAPRAAAIDADAEFPWDLKELLAKQDLLGTGFPEEHGGTGLDQLSQVILVEEIARADATTSLIPIVQKLGALPIMLAGTPEQQARYFPRLASGEWLIAFALTEAAAGSDVASNTMRATRDGDAYVLNGSKRFITHGSVANVLTAFALTDPKAGGRQGDERLHRRDRHAGLRGAARRAQDGDPGLTDRGADIRRRAGACRQPDRRRRVTASRSRCGRSTERGRHRGPGRGHRPGRARGGHRATPRSASSSGSGSATSRGSQRCWPTWTRHTEAARQLPYKAVRRDRGRRRRPAVLDGSASSFAGDVAMQVTTDAVQVLGGYGYIDEYPVERMMRDAKITQLYEGTQQIQRLIVARQLLARAGVSAAR